MVTKEIEQTSDKVYSEADMYIAIQYAFKTVQTDGFIGSNVTFKELYSHFINNRKKILQWELVKK